MVKMATTLMHVAPRGDGFGIRIRLSRALQGVWMGEGWESRPKEAAAVGATATKEGWHWNTREEADAGLIAVAKEIEEHAFREGIDG